MKIHEYQAKEIFSAYGIPVEKHTLCHTIEEVIAAYEQMKLPKVVVKAQVLTGGRGKAGGVKLVKSYEDLLPAATSILGMSIKDLPVEKVLVSEAVNIAKEFYVGMTIDRNLRSVILMMSAAGGMDIEEVARLTPELIIRHRIDPSIGIPDFAARHFAFSLSVDLNIVTQLSSILQRMYQTFIETDASLVEVNPLVLTAEHRLIAIDGKMTFDNNALYRQPHICDLAELTEEEKVESAAKERGFSYVGMDGNIGCMVNGAGLAMTTMDMIKLYGGTPANFLDIGGSSNPNKVIEAIKLLLKDSHVKAVLINIFGGITRCDDVAIGLLEAFEQIQTDIPVIVRLTGTNEQAGRRLLQGNDRFLVAETMKEATLLAIQSIKA